MTSTELLSLQDAKVIQKRFRALLLISIIYVLAGTVIMMAIEGLRFIDGLYFSVVSLTTVGYGDFTPATDVGKIFIMVYLLIGIAIIAALINNLFRSALARRVIKKSPESDNINT